MTRFTWFVLFLLVASNAAWVLSRDDPKGDDGTDTTDGTFSDAETVDLERTVADLQDEVARLRGAEPVLLGAGEAERAQDAAPDVADAAATGAAKTDAAAHAAKRAAVAKDVARKKAYAAALATAKEMLRKVMQVEDAGLRAEGLREITAALQGDDKELIEYTLSTLYSLRDATFDKSAFQGLVREHLESEDGGIRRSALYALHAVDPEGADVRTAWASANDPDPRVRTHSAKLMSLYGGPELGPESTQAVVQLLEDESLLVRRGTLRGLSNTHVTPDLEQKLIELAADPKMRRETVEFALSQLREKSRTVVDALFAHLEDGNTKVRQRAHWGLQRGVRKSEQHYVATKYAERLGKFVNPKSQREAMQLIARYGDDRLAPQLERFAENELVDEKVRALARKAAEYLLNKKAAR